jgi:hypothetical protein
MPKFHVGNSHSRAEVRAHLLAKLSALTQNLIHRRAVGETWVLQFSQNVFMVASH